MLIDTLAFELEVEGFFASFNSFEFLNKYYKKKITDEEFDIFLKQLSYSRYLKNNKASSQFTTNQNIVAISDGFKG